MKQIDNVFLENLTYDNLYRAFIISKRCKSLKRNVIYYDLKYEYHLKDTLKKLKEGNYNFGKYNKFKVYEPKERIILSAPFKDRVVHTFLVKNFLEPYFVPMFINTSYACIKGKGMHKCALDVKRAIYNISKKWENAYIIKMDVSKFFYNIDRDILFDIISRKIIDKKLLEVLKKVIYIEDDYGVLNGLGIPIGNYTSQIFANIYLNEVDWYIKRDLKCKYVYRYMDDSIVICENKEEAQEKLKLIEKFYNEKLHLKLNKKTQIFKVGQGVNFCGYKIFIGKMKLRNKGKTKLKRKMKKVQELLKRKEISVAEAKMMLTGHVGYIKYSDSDNLIKKVFGF